jgi:hypothetical protein
MRFRLNSAAADDHRHVETPHTHDRRHAVRGTAEGEPERRLLLSMILGTYREMPGLTLHLRQAARLFGLRTTTCEVVLDDMVRTNRLRKAADGQYVSAAR